MGRSDGVVDVKVDQTGLHSQDSLYGQGGCDNPLSCGHEHCAAVAARDLARQELRCALARVEELSAMWAVERLNHDGAWLTVGVYERESEAQADVANAGRFTLRVRAVLV